MPEKTNTFAEMEKNSAQNSEETQVKEPLQQGGEINIEDFSDVAVGDRIKYVRPDLDGKEDIVEKFQVFLPGPNDELKVSKNKSTEYWSVKMVITYKSKNDDGVNNREYISGAICFKQKDGTASDPSFWYEGCEHQSGMVWEKVANALGIEPKDLSPRQFVAFLNSKPKVTIKGIEYDNFTTDKNLPKFVTKNMPDKFTKA